ncbi:hypothetical protein PT974_09736 [Cladobotryum mycophilum]|uniref:Uncharacterized protein n=1 Tax=Cladobotryum mycophilum TaxID=491253 RepID=A0ABR0SH04_9HYPO
MLFFKHSITLFTALTIAPALGIPVAGFPDISGVSGAVGSTVGSLNSKGGIPVVVEIIRNLDIIQIAKKVSDATGIDIATSINYVTIIIDRIKAHPEIVRDPVCGALFDILSGATNILNPITASIAQLLHKIFGGDTASIFPKVDLKKLLTACPEA